MKAIIVADGSPPARATFDLDATDTLIVAADGGALKADILGLSPHVVVGDGDSLGPTAVAGLRARGTEVVLHDRDKDESDTELAIKEARRRGADTLVILAALGGARFDHALANVLLLALPELDSCDAVIADGPSDVRLLGGPGGGTLELLGDPGDYVSLLPLTERAEGVTTAGLRYPLDDEPLVLGPARGLSNEIGDDGRARIDVRSGRLAVVHTSARELISDD